MIAVDIIIVILLAAGTYDGYKRGFVEGLLRLIGSIVVFICAYIFRGPLSTYLMQTMPTLKFGGIFAGVTSLNVMVYEAIAFFILVILFGILLNILLRLSGIVNKLLNTTFITGIPNKVLGAALNFVRFYVLLFIAVFILSLIPQTNKTVMSAYLPPVMLEKTPVLSTVVKDFTKSFEEINNLLDSLNKESENEDLNGQILDILLKYNILTKDTAIKLHEADKLDVENFDEIIEKY